MRRFVGPVLGLLLLVSGRCDGLSAQQGRASPLLKIQEPRPAPVFPVALVPFTIGPEACRGGRQPIVTFEVYNALARPEAVLRLRTKNFEPIDSLRMRCGDYVAIWDGTIGNGRRLANPGVYYLRLVVGAERDSKRLVVTGP